VKTRFTDFREVAIVRRSNFTCSICFCGIADQHEEDEGSQSVQRLPGDEDLEKAGIQITR
jgi:hypothetical protein